MLIVARKTAMFRRQRNGLAPQETRQASLPIRVTTTRSRRGGNRGREEPVSCTNATCD